MNRKSEINKVMTVIALRDGTKWIIHSLDDEITAQSWFGLDESESESERLGLELCWSNIRTVINSNKSNQ